MQLKTLILDQGFLQAFPLKLLSRSPIISLIFYISLNFWVGEDTLSPNPMTPHTEKYGRYHRYQSGELGGQTSFPHL